MRHTTIAIAASAALIGGAALAVTAQGQDQTTKTITFTAGQPARRDIKQIDIKPHGESLGDEHRSRDRAPRRQANRTRA